MKTKIHTILKFVSRTKNREGHDISHSNKTSLKYDPYKHHRRSIRLKGYDYSQPGWYYVTMCTQNREHLFGEIVDGEMVLNMFGKIVDYHWRRLPVHFKNIELDEFQIMPNHFHGIIEIVGAMHLNLSIENNTNKSNINASPQIFLNWSR